MNVKYELESNIASKWWSENIGQNAKQNNGNEIESNMLSILARTTIISDEQKSLFYASLKQKIKEALRKNSGKLVVSVNPAADIILLESARECEFPSSVFPCKTTMLIESGRVAVSCGFKAPFEDLYIANEKQSEQGIEMN